MHWDIGASHERIHDRITGRTGHRPTLIIGGRQMSYPQAYTQSVRIITKRYNRYSSVAVNRYQIVIKQTVRRTLKPLDSTVYAGQVQAEKERIVRKENDYHSFSSKKIKIKKRLLRPLVSLSILIASLGAPHATAATTVDHLKLYAHTSIIDYEQTLCFYDIVYRESRWNYKSRNSTHFGLIQMKNQRVRYMNPYAQIDMGIKYLKTRYGSICNGHRHLLKHGWQ